MKKIGLAYSLLVSSLAAQAHSDEVPEALHGVLYVSGSLTESPCLLEMDTAHQDIRLGNIATGRLQQPGERGEAVTFSLRLQDCHPSAGMIDYRTLNLAWAPLQAGVRVSFQSEQDSNNPELAQVNGASGFGLRISDAKGRNVDLGERGRPLLLVPGQNTLYYNVALERTSGRLVPGRYSAIVNFNLSYD